MTTFRGSIGLTKLPKGFFPHPRPTPAAKRLRTALSYIIYREQGSWKRNDPPRSPDWEVSCVHTPTVTFSRMVNPREGDPACQVG